MTLKPLLFLVFLLVQVVALSQQDSVFSLKSKVIDYGDYMIFEGDTLVIELKEVNLLSKLNFKTKEDRNYYYWLRRKVHKAYPYAKLTKERLSIINHNLDNLSSKRQKKIYLKRLQDYFEGEFTEQLKKLTTTEGRILINLIHRQTGETVYELAKDYKSGWSAFWSQKTAKLFKLDLKDTYQPATDNEDYLTELIITRAFEERTLEFQPTLLSYDFEQIQKSKDKFLEIEHRVKSK